MLNHLLFGEVDDFGFLRSDCFNFHTLAMLLNWRSVL